MNEEKKTLSGEVREIFDRFARQELGNRLSEFAFSSFLAVVLTKIAEYQGKEEKGEESHAKD